jgi:hypothetical protein
MWEFLEALDLLVRLRGCMFIYTPMVNVVMYRKGTDLHTDGRL